MFGDVLYMKKIELRTPFRTVIVKVLSFEPQALPVLGRTEKEDIFFKDLLKIGCDFYELLELFANCDAITKKNINCIMENMPLSKKITDCSEKGLRQMIPHWSSSRYHSATIKEICNELKTHIENNTEGLFVYNSNANIQSKKAYNDVYILLIMESKKFFFDINRKKTYEIINNSEVTKNV